MTNTRPTVFREDQPEDPGTKPGMKCGGGGGPADAGHECAANAGKLRAGNARLGISRDVAPVPVYYNEFDPGAAQWLRNLMGAGLIPSGVIDTRSIVEVQPDDLDGFVQCHFFAGIGGWPRALQLAGYPATEPVWTASFPCQPFSNAGKGLGEADERHLWPVGRDLIEKCRPARVFGEQVASKAGRDWLAGIFADLEAMGYAVAGADLCSAGAGSPHIRQRLYWMADSDSERRNGKSVRVQSRRSHEEGSEAAGRGSTDGVADANDTGPQGRGERGDGTGQRTARSRGVAIECGDGKVRRIPESVFLSLADGFPAGVDRLPPRQGYPLAQGVEGRVTALKGIGNAIDPVIASEFIAASMEALQ